MRNVVRSSGWALVIALIGGCKGSSTDVALSKKAVAAEDDAVANVPVPASDGPKLVALRPGVSVVDRASKSGQQLGALRVGGTVARAEHPYKVTESCPGGWYPVRPRGLVCADESVSLVAAVTLPAPDASQALPHRYARLRSGAPYYTRIPTPDEQAENEPDLEKALAKAKVDKPVTRAGANDVPVDDNGVPVGAPVIKTDAPGVGPDGRRTEASYFAYPLAGVAPGPGASGAGPVVARALRKGSGLAIIGTVAASGPHGTRMFGVTAEGGYVPIDRLEPALGSTFGGVDLGKDKTLPVAFVLRHEVAPYEMKGGKAARLDDEEIERRSALFLTGRFRTIDSIRYEEAEDGKWYRGKDLIKIVKRSKVPDFVADGVKWVDVSLALQTMTLYEGKKPVFATLVSSGSDVLGDPATSAATLQGTFKITKKALTQALDPLEAQSAFEVLDAPWYLEYSPGFAFVGSFWSDPFGEARSHHDIALSPVDARRLFQWAGSEIPDGWSWFAPSESETIVVNVRK
jgi:hypothetical protein